MTFDATETMRSTLRHCLWLAARDEGYAIWAAADYERKSAGLLKGLADKVQGAIARHHAEGAGGVDCKEEDC
jgi:hypothetical protein